MSEFIYFDHKSKEFENGSKLERSNYYEILEELDASADEVKIKLIDNEWIYAIKDIWYGDDGEGKTIQLLASICKNTQKMFIVIKAEWLSLGVIHGSQISFSNGGIWVTHEHSFHGKRECSSIFKIFPKTYTHIKTELVDALIFIHSKDVINIIMSYTSDGPIDKNKRLI